MEIKDSKKIIEVNGKINYQVQGVMKILLRYAEVRSIYELCKTCHIFLLLNVHIHKISNKRNGQCFPNILYVRGVLNIFMKPSNMKIFTRSISIISLLFHSIRPLRHPHLLQG